MEQLSQAKYFLTGVTYVNCRCLYDTAVGVTSARVALSIPPQFLCISVVLVNTRAWSDYLKLNTSLLVSLVTIASVCVILLSVCLVIACRPHHPHSPAPLAQPPADPDRVALIAFADTVQVYKFLTSVYILYVISFSNLILWLYPFNMFTALKKW